MINIYTLYNQVNFTSEQIILFGLVDTLPIEPHHFYNHKNESRYKGMIDFCKKNINYVNTPEECDIIVLPYKFKNTTDHNYINLNTLSKELNKPLWCFYNDDNNTYGSYRNCKVGNYCFYADNNIYADFYNCYFSDASNLSGTNANCYFCINDNDLGSGIPIVNYAPYCVYITD